MSNNGNNSPLIRTRGLKKYFKIPMGMLHAVDDINLSIEAGKTLGVVGESGCGKSTLGRTILRLIDATAGEIFYKEDDILQYNKKQMLNMRKHMQIIFQDPFSSLDSRMTVFQLISEPLVINNSCSSKKELTERVFDLMNIVGLADYLDNTYPHELDGGRRQRIGIARALALNPDFIVCDEPVSALDVSIQAQVLNLLMDIQDKLKVAYMFITHNLSVVKHIADDIMVLYLGQCVEQAPYNVLFSNPVHPYTKALLQAIPIAKINRGKKRELLTGELTSPINPPVGCRFAARCKYIQKGVCDQDMSLTEISENHFVMCPVVTGK